VLTPRKGAEKLVVRELTEEEIRESSQRVEEAIFEAMQESLAVAEGQLAHARQLLEYLREQRAGGS
jgi:hypothetical protein